MRRKDVDRVKAQAEELLHRIDMMERCAGWHRFVQVGLMVNEESSRPHPDDIFTQGQFTASVKRASMDLTRSLVGLRR
jgi:hypothetical protein